MKITVVQGVTNAVDLESDHERRRAARKLVQRVQQPSDDMFRHKDTSYRTFKEAQESRSSKSVCLVVITKWKEYKKFLRVR